MLAKKWRLGSIGAVIIGILLLLPFNISSLIFFLFGVVITICVEIVLFYLYLSKAPDPISNPLTHFSLSEITQDKQDVEDEDELSDPLRSSRGELDDGTPAPPMNSSLDLHYEDCLCKRTEFGLICSSKEYKFKKVSNFIREIINLERLYGTALGKLGEANFLEKLQKKKAAFLPGEEEPWTGIKQAVNSIGKKHIDNAEFIQHGVMATLAAIQKDTKCRLQDLQARQKTAGGNFVNISNNLVKIKEKLDVLRVEESKANSAYEKAKKNLANFSTVARKEMELKVVRNEVNHLETRYKECKDSLMLERDVYLPKMKDIMNEFRALQTSQAEGVRNLLLSLMGTIEETFKADLEIWQLAQESQPVHKPSFIDDATEEIRHKVVSLFDKAFKKKGNEDQVKQKEIENASKAIADYIEDIETFLSGMIAAEEQYSSGLEKLTLYDPRLIEIGLREVWYSIKTNFCNLIIVDDQYIEELKQAHSTFMGLAKALHEFQELIPFTGFEELDARVANLKQQRVEYSAHCKANLQLALVVRLQEMCKNTSFVANNMPEASLHEWESFSHKGCGHKNECPCFMPRTELRSIKRLHTIDPDASGKPESARWFNQVLKTFIYEWADSPKFQVYIQRRLTKVYNKDRPQFISVINVTNVEIFNQALNIHNITPLVTSNEYEFYYDIDVNFKGEVKISLEFDLQWTLATLSTSIKVVLKSLYGKLRLFYTPSDLGKSWYCFVSEPVTEIALDPILGKQNKLALSRFPQLNTFLVTILSRSIRKLVWPNRRPIKIPKGRGSVTNSE
jgi:hypothetical protein